MARSKGPIKINPKVHDLSNHGYHHVVDIPTKKRHEILLKTLAFLQHKDGEKEGFRKIIEQLNAVAVLERYSDPASAKIFREDRDWVSELYKEWKKKYN